MSWSGVKWGRFLPVEREFFIPTVAKCLVGHGLWLLGVFLVYRVFPCKKKWLGTTDVVIWGSCSSGGSAGHQIIRREVVWSLAASVCMPNSLGQDTKSKMLSDASIGMSVLHRKYLCSKRKHRASCINCFECSGRVEKHYIRTSPFSIWC